MEKKILALIGLAIFLIVLSQVEINKVLTIVYNADLFFIGLALFVFAIMLILKGVKWKYILLSQEIDLGVLKASKYFTIGFFFSSFTPGRIGDFARAIYVAKKNGFMTGLASVFLDRLIDITLLLFFAFIGALFFAKEKKFLDFQGVVIASTIALLFFVVVVLMKKKQVKRILKIFYLFFIPESAKGLVSEKFSEFISAFQKSISKRTFFSFAVLSGLVFWLLTILFAQLLAYSIGIKISYHEMLVLYSMISLADVLPITISGIGTRESIAVLFFSLLNLEPEKAIAFSLMLFSTSYLLTAFIGYLSFVTEPIDFKEWTEKIRRQVNKNKIKG